MSQMFPVEKLTSASCLISCILLKPPFSSFAHITMTIIATAKGMAQEAHIHSQSININAVRIAV